MAEATPKGRKGVKLADTNKENKEIFIGLRIAPSVDAMVAHIAEVERRGKAEIIRLALSDWLDMWLTDTLRQSVAGIRSKTADDIAAATGMTDEEVVQLQTYIKNESRLGAKQRRASSLEGIVEEARKKKSSKE